MERNRLTLLRTRNEDRCRRLLDRSGLLDTTGIDFDRAADVELPDGILHCLVYMRDVENFTNRDLVGLAGHPKTLADPIVNRFLDCWRAEEAEHARALDQFLDHYARASGVTVPSIQPAPPAVLSRQERITLAVTRPVGHVVTAAHMAWGATNELLTMTGYRLLAHQTNNPVLTELLLRIAAQESRHYSFYMLQTEWRLADSALARVIVPRLLRTTWTPVGVGGDYKAPEEFDRVLDAIVDGDTGRAAVARMDATMARLPGCENLKLFTAATDQSHQRLAEAA